MFSGTVRMIRLSGDRPEGLAEVFKNGRWGTLCDHSLGLCGWPSVYCRQFGFIEAGNAVRAKDVPEYNVTGILDRPVATPTSVGCSPQHVTDMAFCPDENNEDCHPWVVTCSMLHICTNF